MRSQVGRTFSSLRKSFPNMGAHFPCVGSPLPTWESIFHVSEVRSQHGRAFSTCRKSAPNMGGHFRHFEKPFSDVNELACAALHSPAPFDRLGGG